MSRFEETVYDRLVFPTTSSYVRELQEQDAIEQAEADDIWSSDPALIVEWHELLAAS